MVTAGCAESPPTREISLSGAGTGNTITFTCGPDGDTCQEALSTETTDSRGSFRKVVELPVGTTARVAVSGMSAKSCRISDATDGIVFDRQIPYRTFDDAACSYFVVP